MNEILIAPSEPAVLRALGRVSALPEHCGVDYMTKVSPRQYCGVQRKALPDFLASMRDGRLVKEVEQMHQVSPRKLIVEGRPMYTSEGVLTSVHGKWTKGQITSLLDSVQAQGVLVTWTTDESDTASEILRFFAWSGKAEHRALFTFPKTPTSKWGTVESEPWIVRLLSSFDGISLSRARAIIKHWKDTGHAGAPIVWHPEASEEFLVSVPGIGKPTARRLLGALGAVVSEVKVKKK